MAAVRKRPYRMRKSFRVGSHALEEIRKEKLFSWVIPVPKKALQLYKQNWSGEMLGYQLPCISPYTRHYSSYVLCEIININPGGDIPCYVVLQGCCGRRLHDSNISKEGEEYEKNLLDKNYGEGFYEKNPWVLEYTIVKLNMTYFDYIYEDHDRKYKYWRFCDKKGYKDNDPEAIKAFVKKYRL